MTTEAPPDASLSVMARPMPLEPPVISATFPLYNIRNIIEESSRNLKNYKFFDS